MPWIQHRTRSISAETGVPSRNACPSGWPPDGEAPDAIARVLQHDHAAVLQVVFTQSERLAQPRDDGARTLVPEPKDDNAWLDVATGGEEVAEVKVEGEEDPTFSQRL